MNVRVSFNRNEIVAMSPSGKIGLVATKNADGLPHLSFLTSIMPIDEKHMCIGEFCRGESKRNMQINREVGWLIMTMDRRLWRGLANWTDLKKEGSEYETYNRQPMFRYNTYFGINTVHYLDLLEAGAEETLPLLKIGISTALTAATAHGLHEEGPKVMNHFSSALFDNFKSLKFIAYIDSEGKPRVVPLLQCRASDSHRLAFCPLAYGNELKNIEPGSSVAVMALSMQMENVLVRGVFAGFRRSFGLRLGQIDLNYVYNSMPPCHGQIYPPLPLEAVKDFHSEEKV